MCNLASLALPMYVTNEKFDFERLEYVTGVVTRNLNQIIDVNFYPVPEVCYDTSILFICWLEVVYFVSRRSKLNLWILLQIFRNEDVGAEIILSQNIFKV